MTKEELKEWVDPGTPLLPHPDDIVDPENYSPDPDMIELHEFFKKELGDDYVIVIGHQPIDDPEKPGEVNYDDPFYNDNPGDKLGFLLDKPDAEYVEKGGYSLGEGTIDLEGKKLKAYALEESGFYAYVTTGEFDLFK
jgi:hypothetical protein